MPNFVILFIFRKKFNYARTFVLDYCINVCYNIKNMLHEGAWNYEISF